MRTKSLLGPFLKSFKSIGIKDLPLVGGKNASLGEMTQKLKKSVRIPEGFAITAHAYRYFLEENGLRAPLQKILQEKDLTKASLKARNLFLKAKLPEALIKSITKGYKRLSTQCKTKNLDVAVRSSATAEDLPGASFAGQQESYLHIRGIKKLLHACKHCFASLFTERAIIYRNKQGFDHFDVALSIGVQKMVRSDKASSGVIFTLDTESGFRNVVFITGSYGVGESIVQGSVNPDEFYVFKPTKKLIYKQMGEKSIRIMQGKKAPTPVKLRERFCITDKEVLALAEAALAIEAHYKQPMDIEWAQDAPTGALFIVQARPETVQSSKNTSFFEEYHLEGTHPVITSGKSIGKKIATGKAHVIKSVKDIKLFKAGEILVTEITDPDWVPIMEKASAIVTNRGGRTSHAAIVSRELGLPCIVGTNNATEVIKTGQPLTINCSEGETGFVHPGILKFSKKQTSLGPEKLKTDLLLNVSSPLHAFDLSFLPSGGVGLAREEFIISESIRIHPMALVHFDKIQDKKVRAEINQLTKGYPNKKEYFVEKLSFGIALIAAAFYPRPVILRFSDFKTNEYANLIGGAPFEPLEENPMIGWRGASRYYDPHYEEGFALECAAVKKVREEFGLINLKVMIPVCRTLEEGKKVLKVLKKNGLEKGKKGLEVYVMCELPSNVILAKEFCALFDGMSIGSNDLTQMILGLDRDSSLVAPLFDENNAAVKKMIKEVISIAKANKCKIGICGDAPSTYPDFAKFLVDQGIDSISLSPDALIKTRHIIAAHEKNKK